MRISVDPVGYATAADLLGDAGELAAAALARLHHGLAGSGAMAGDDAASEGFARTYDDLASTAVDAMADLVDAIGTTAVLTARSGERHARADAAASVVPRDADHRTTLVPARPTRCRPPSALGADDPDTPALWDLVADHLEGYTWPGADTRRLHDAARAWSDAASELIVVERLVGHAVRALEEQHSPEIEVACDSLRELLRHAVDLADSLEAVGRSCASFADQVETTKEVVRGLLQELAVELGTTAVISGVTSVVTFGGAAAVGAGVTAVRVATKAREIVAAFRALKALHCVEAVRKETEGLGRMRKALQRYRNGSELLEAQRVVPHLARIDPPPLSASAKQLQRKYKHVKDFDPTMEPNYSPRNAALFEQRLRQFVERPDVVTRRVSYRGGLEGLVTFDPATGKMLMQYPDGRVWSGWDLSRVQLIDVIKNGHLW